MNKETIDQEIKIAYEVLSKTGIAVDGKIKKTFRGQISSFGAAVSMGSLLSAIAFFSQDAKQDTKQEEKEDIARSKLMIAIFEILKQRNLIPDKCKTLFDYVKEGEEDDCKEEILNAAIALKLSMNLYELVKE